MINRTKLKICWNDTFYIKVHSPSRLKSFNNMLLSNLDASDDSSLSVFCEYGIFVINVWVVSVVVAFTHVWSCPICHNLCALYGCCWTDPGHLYSKILHNNTRGFGRLPPHNVNVYSHRTMGFLSLWRQKHTQWLYYAIIFKFFSNIFIKTTIIVVTTGVLLMNIHLSIISLYTLYFSFLAFIFFGDVISLGNQIQYSCRK